MKWDPFYKAEKNMSFIYYDHKFFFFKYLIFTMCTGNLKKVSQEVYFALKCYKS